MEYLARYISPEMAEVIQKPEDRSDLLKIELKRLAEMLAEGSPSTEKEIKAQIEFTNSLKRQVDRFDRLIEDGFVEFIPSVEPQTQESEKLKLSYELKDGKVYQMWSVSKDPQYYSKKIDALKADLSASDYKIIKCYEASLAGETCPYDASELISKRNDIRAHINGIEAEMEKL